MLSGTIKSRASLLEGESHEPLQRDRIADAQVVALVEGLLYPRPLSRIQAIVLQETWSGKSYRETAREHGYDEGFIRNVGAELWRLLSEAMGKKVTKSNVRWMLQGYFQREE